LAGPEPTIRDAKDSKNVVAPASISTPCDWNGFYIGLHAGGQFGDSTSTDVDDYNDGMPSVAHTWSYDQSGFVAGLQLGFNWQWHWLVFGPEIDLGYMNLDGKRTQPGSPGGDTFGKTESDFYTTWRARVGVAFQRWLFYATGGGIGVRYEPAVIDDRLTGGGGQGLIDASTSDFVVGWTVGGGMEYCFSSHWSAKIEYLHFDLGDDTFSGVISAGADTGQRLRFNAESEGHIVRAGLNFRF
jgi:outer membrane immunogenic protein